MSASTVWFITAIACSGALIAAGGWRVQVLAILSAVAAVSFLILQIGAGKPTLIVLIELYAGLAVLQISYFAGAYIFDDLLAPDDFHAA